VRASSLKAADFQRALGTRPLSRTAHFVLHALLKAEPDTPVQAKLSTSEPSLTEVPVDDLSVDVFRLGLVLPKKQARRSVTRSLIRHQAREALRRHGQAAHQVHVASADGARLEGWVLRLRAPFDRATFPSAASAALSAAVRAELDELWLRVAKPKSGGARSAPSSRPSPSGEGGAGMPESGAAPQLSPGAAA
jgi:ribonuclease P protein component